MAKIGRLLAASVVCFLIVDVVSATVCETLCNGDAGTECSNIFFSWVLDTVKADYAALYLLCCLGVDPRIDLKINYIKDKVAPETLRYIFQNISSVTTAKKFAIFVRNCSKGSRTLSPDDWHAYNAGELECADNPCNSS